ncbi:MAG: TonB-dependent receptor [Opitutaceae bacterium]
MNRSAFCPWLTLLRCPLVASILLFIWLTPLARLSAAEGELRTFDVPPGMAETTLRRFGDQAGGQFIFSAEKVRGVETQAVKGRFTPIQALNSMLAGTDLVPVRDDKTGALTVTRMAGDEKNGQSRPANAAAAAGRTVTLQKYEVSSTKVDGIINKSLLPTGENVAMYHEVITRTEIERMGVTSFEELFRYIPQTTTGANGFQTPPNNVNVSGGTVANISRVGLRGFPQAQTLILINGRVQPRSGTSNTSGTDLSRIPIAAIERVEILPLSGSAMYGGGSIGGAINIILRKEYSAQEITSYVGTSWDGGATEYRVSYLDGRTFDLFGRKTNLTMLLDYRHRDPLFQSDRNYLNRVLERYGPNTPYRNAAGVSAFELYTLNTFAGSPATILVGNAPTAAVNDLGIPGAPGLRWVQVPAGTSPDASQTLTPASFTSVAGQFTPGERFAEQAIYTPEDNYSVNFQLEHALSDRISLYSEVGYVYVRSKYTFPQSLVLNLTATDPLNPFRTNVTPGFVGRPIRIFFDPLDIADPSAFEERETIRGLVGAKGKFFDSWEWSFDGSYDYNHTFTGSNNTVNSLPTLLVNGLTGTDTVTGLPRVPAPLATRRALYPVLADHRRFPVPASDTDKYWYSWRNSGSFTNNFIGITRVAGSLIDLPAGPLNLAALGDYTQFDRKGGQEFSNSDDLYLLMSGFPFRNTPSGNPNKRVTVAGAVEMVVPVFNDKWRPGFVPLKSLELNFSTRRERAKSEFISPSNGAFAENSKPGKSYVAAAKLQVLQDVAVRYSFSDGVYVPDWNDFGDPRNTFLNFLAAPDPKRGNTSQPTNTYNVLNGGNPNLKSETSVSQNVGVILNPRFVRGLSVTLDYWRIEKEDGISLIQAPQLVILSDDFPDRVIRDPLTAADRALGYTAGLITYIDQTRINVARIETDGIDTQIRYDFEVAKLGEFQISANSSFTNHFKTQNVVGGAYIESAGASGPKRWRGRGAVTWIKDRWEATLSTRYTGHYSTATTTASPAFPTGFPFDGGRTPAVMRYDAQVSYSVPAAMREGWRTWLSGTKWTVGCQNLLNDEPSLVTNGTSYYNSEDDPRQRYVYVSIKKSL